MSTYTRLIRTAKSLDALNAIVERAAYDDDLSTAEYCELVSMAHDVMRLWSDLA